MVTTKLENEKQLIKFQNFSNSSSQELRNLEEVLENLGLHLSEKQVDGLRNNKLVSLEYLTLADLGTILLLAGTINAQKFKHSNLSFQDLLMFDGNSNTLGIPLYCWDALSVSTSSTSTYLRLTFFTGKPALLVQKERN